jgi:hypothetical protein
MTGESVVPESCYSPVVEWKVNWIGNPVTIQVEVTADSFRDV